MALFFTFILEFQGTTSVHQIEAQDVDAALEAWVQGLAVPADMG